MTPEFLNGLVGVVVGGIIATVTSIATTWLSQRGEQRKLRVEIWREQYKRLQDVLAAILTHPMDKQNANPLGSIMFAFRSRISIASPILHLLSKSVTDELQELSDLIGKAWVDQLCNASDPKTIEEITRRISPAEQRLLAEINEKLVVLEQKINSY